MTAKQTICPDCGKSSVTGEELGRLREEEVAKVCRCVVKIGGFSQTTQAKPNDPQQNPGKSTRAWESFREGLGPPKDPRKPWPDFLGWVMGAFGVAIFFLGVFGCAFAITHFAMSNSGNRWQISVNPMESFFIQLVQSIALIVGGSVMYLLARIGHLLWRAQIQSGR